MTARPNIAGLTGKRHIATGRANIAGLTGKRPRPVADPLKDVEYTGDLGKDAATELTALETAYRDRARNETDRFKASTDSEYWIAVCFTSRDEKEQFLARHNLADLGDKYLDGRQVDQRLT